MKSMDGMERMNLDAYQQMITILGSEAIVSKITELNDWEGKSFSEIADALEKKCI